MKRIIGILGMVGAGTLILLSCTNNQTKNVTKEVKDTTKICYLATFEGDTAVLNLKITDSTKVDGDLVINYANSPKNVGIVRGEFKGDTLFVDYSFKIGDGKNEFSNPLAFLKRDSTLAMGVGQILTAYGRSYFDPKKPINFERGKFTFYPQNCK